MTSIEEPAYLCGMNYQHGNIAIFSWHEIINSIVKNFMKKSSV